MGSVIDPDIKQQAELEAAEKTDWERQRIDSYRSLRYEFTITDVDSWLDSIYESQKAIYKPIKDPSWNQIREHAEIGLLEQLGAFMSADKKNAIAVKKEQSRKFLQNEVDQANILQKERCERKNSRLRVKLNEKLEALLAHESQVVEEYFTFSLQQDSYWLDEDQYPIDFNISYLSGGKRLIIDYKLPTMNQISKVKEWKVNKDNEITPKDMNRTDYLEMYERILFDLSVRTVSILFSSDSKNTIAEVVFNGSCVYSDWQKMPTVLLSFVMPKEKYSYEKIASMDYLSKREIAKLNEVEYLDDIHSLKAPAALWEEPPSRLVVPIQSSF